MLFKLLENEKIDIIVKHRQLCQRMIKCNILTLDKQISDRTGTIIRDYENNPKYGNYLLKRIIKNI